MSSAKMQSVKMTACSQFDRLHFDRAKPVSEMEQSGIERALRSKISNCLQSILTDCI